MNEGQMAGERAEGMSDSSWFEDWFADPRYLKLYSHRNLAEADRVVELIVRTTEVLPPADVLDLACGAGRHAVALATRGYRVTAVDLSTTLLDAALRNARDHNVVIEFLERDMRHIEFERRFDLVAQLFTSFGYFETPEEDLEVIRHVRRALRPRGWYVLDLINPDMLRSTLVAENMTWMEGATVVERREIVGERVVKHIEIHDDDDRISRFTESVHLYRLEEITAMLQESGFKVDHTLGTYDGAPFDPGTSTRMIIFARVV